MYVVDLRDADADGFLVKRQVVDLLERLLLIDDNNYPFRTGRNPSLPDDNELIIVRTGALKT